MSKKCLFSLILFFLLLFSFQPAYADMVGIVYIVMAPLLFFVVYPITVVVEAVVLTKLFKYDKYLSGSAAMSANMLSLIAGAAFYFLGYNLYSLLYTVYPPLLSFFARVAVFYLLSVVIEWPIYYRYKIGKTAAGSLVLTMIINICSYIVLTAPLYYLQFIRH
jgi:hypothetical protein